MRRVSAFFLAVAVLGMLGCREESPIISAQAVDGGLFMGRFIFKEPGRTPKSWTLSQKQVDLLNSWFDQHQSGWGMIVVSPPPPSFTVVAKRANGKTNSIDLFAKDPWGRGDGNWDKVIVIWAENAGENRIASFSAEEVTHLHRQLGESQ
jgi:hypothetical protein